MPYANTEGGHSPLHITKVARQELLLSLVSCVESTCIPFVYSIFGANLNESHTDKCFSQKFFLPFPHYYELLSVNIAPVYDAQIYHMPIHYSPTSSCWCHCWGCDWWRSTHLSSDIGWNCDTCCHSLMETEAPNTPT